MKQIQNSKDIRGKILSGLSLITEPVVQTLSPKGKNVLFEDKNGGIFVTNDGVTIAKQIESEDPIEDAVIRVVKYGALETNREAGDGTTTTTLFANAFIREGYRLLDDGMNEMELKKVFNDYVDRVVNNLNPIKVSNDTELMNIANISANNDPEIAENVVSIVKTAGQSGMVFINPSPTGKTEVIKDTGYVFNSGFFAQELINDGVGKAAYDNVHVLITDKRLYYEEECQAVLSVAIEAGIQNLVIVARDFIGKAPNFLMANHVNKYINLLLIKMDGNDAAYGDLATYLGGDYVTEKSGKLINNITTDDFIVAAKVYSTRERSVFQTANPGNSKLQALVQAVQDAKDNEPDDREIERRLSSLTTGIVTVNVGGTTQIETQENIYRYEDAINATRAAMKDGYLPGGGLAVFNATREEQEPVFRRIGEVSIRQIAKNCGKHEDFIVANVGGVMGYDAKLDTFTNLLDSGVIDPYKVTEMALRNSVSVAIALLTSGFIIVHKKDTKENDSKE